MSARATTIEAPGQISKISGSKRPEAAGHRFGPELVCIECGKTWDDHQADPSACAPAPEPVTDFATRVDNGL